MFTRTYLAAAGLAGALLVGSAAATPTFAGWYCPQCNCGWGGCTPQPNKVVRDHRGTPQNLRPAPTTTGSATVRDHRKK